MHTEIGLGLDTPGSEEERVLALEYGNVPSGLYRVQNFIVVEICLKRDHMQDADVNREKQ
jgi:hypothetical protein